LQKGVKRTITKDFSFPYQTKSLPKFENHVDKSRWRESAKARNFITCTSRTEHF